jgi:hypothetical protein
VWYSSFIFIALNKRFVEACWLLALSQRRYLSSLAQKNYVGTPENKVKHKGAESLGAFILFGVTDNSVEICQILEKKDVLI